MSEHASTQPTSYKMTTLVSRGIWEKRCSISATLYFCCSLGVSILVKKRGMSWQHMSTITPVSSKLSIATFCFFPSVASYDVLHWSTVLRPCPTPGLIQLLRLHRRSTAQLWSRITYSGHGHADIPPLSTTLGLIPVQSLLHLTVYPALM